MECSGMGQPKNTIGNLDSTERLFNQTKPTIEEIILNHQNQIKRTKKAINNVKKEGLHTQALLCDKIKLIQKELNKAYYRDFIG